LGALTLLFCGCVNTLQPYNQPSQQKLLLETSKPQEYTVRVADKDEYEVPADGRVTIYIPRLERGCSKYLFGLVKIEDSSPYDSPIIHLNKNNRTVRRLSLNDLAKLPNDEKGYQLLRLEH
jgi:hypothetical protein